MNKKLFLFAVYLSLGICPIYSLDRQEVDVNVQSTLQEREITGRVVDVNGEPIIGANVLVRGQNNGVITDVDGKFSLLVPQKATLRISYIGYTTQEVSLTNKSSYLITLLEDTKSLDEVVVVGYGTMKKSDLTASVASVKGDVITASASTSITDALQGKVPGMDIQSSRYEGDNREIRIRGSRSLNASNEPLVIIDGVPGSMNEVNTNDIKSIEVLKDASSAAIYGSRGANGVIIITTKRGTVGKTTISYDAFYGINKPQFMKMMSGDRFVQLRRDVYKIANNLWGQEVNDENIFSDDELQMIHDREYYDWQDLIFRNGTIQKHNLSLSSGSEKTKFSLSFAYEKETGYNQNSEASKFYLTSTIDHKVTNWLDFGTAIRLRKRNSSGFATYGQALFYGTPLSRPYDENGDLIMYPNPQESSVSVLADFVDGQYANDTENTNVNLVFSANIHPFKGLSLQSNLGYTYTDTKNGFFYGSQSFQANGGMNQSGKSGSNSYMLTWNNTLTYDKIFNSHHLIFDAITEIQSYQYDEMSAEGQNLDVEQLLYHNIGTNTLNKNIGSGYSDWALASFMGRIRYDYRGRYLANMSIRSDGSSRLAKGNQWATFVSGGAAWRISEEDFLKDVSWISNLKLRYAYGMVGNQAIDPYSTLYNLASYGYKFGSSDGIYVYRPDKLINKDLGWEKTYTHNVGVDFGFFNNRFSGYVEFYNTTTKDLLMERNIPVTTGFSRIWQNIGETQNRGVELSLNGVLVKTKDFNWDLNFNFSYNSNKIISLTNNQDDISNKWFIGKPINVIYDYEKLGIWQLEESEEAAVYGRQPGDVKLNDIDKNGQIAADDKKILGSTDPKYIASLGSYFRWKNLDFSFNLSSRWDYMFLHEGYGWHMILTGTRWVPDVNYWTPDNPSNDYPRPDMEWPENRELLGYMKGDYIKMQDMTLGYDFGTLIGEYVPISRARIYLQVRNAFYLYRAAKEDVIPESPSVELTVPKSFNIGVNLTF